MTEQIAALQAAAQREVQAKTIRLSDGSEHTVEVEVGGRSNRGESERISRA